MIFSVGLPIGKYDRTQVTEKIYFVLFNFSAATAISLSVPCQKFDVGRTGKLSTIGKRIFFIFIPNLKQISNLTRFRKYF